MVRSASDAYDTRGCTVDFPGRHTGRQRSCALSHDEHIALILHCGAVRAGVVDGGGVAAAVRGAVRCRRPVRAAKTSRGAAAVHPHLLAPACAHHPPLSTIRRRIHDAAAPPATGDVVHRVGGRHLLPRHCWRAIPPSRHNAYVPRLAAAPRDAATATRTASCVGVPVSARVGDGGACGASGPRRRGSPPSGYRRCRAELLASRAACQPRRCCAVAPVYRPCTAHLGAVHGPAACHRATASLRRAASCGRSMARISRRVTPARCPVGTAPIAGGRWRPWCCR